MLINKLIDTKTDLFISRVSTPKFPEKY
jgi:hypothetical protein